MLQQAQVVIIGAGLSGISAAIELKQLGLHSIILEARNRIGGRIHTNLSLDKCPIDLGASWYHGTNDNPMLDLLELDLNSNTKTTGKYSQLIETSVDNYWLSTDTRSERLFDQKEEVKEEEILEFSKKYQVFLEELRDIAKNTQDQSITSSSQIFKIMERSNFVTERERKLWRWFLFKREVWMASLLEDLTLIEWEDDSNWGHLEGPHCLVKDGHSKILERLVNMNSLDIRLQHEVTNIEIEKETKKVIVSTINGNQFEGEALLITLPLGVLKNNLNVSEGENERKNGNESIFGSSIHLSKEKLDAIHKLKMGSYGKVVLQFEKAFWNKDLDSKLDDSHSKPENKSKPTKPFLGIISGDSREDFCLFLDYDHVKGKPILVGFTIDQLTRNLEKLSDSQIVEKMVTDLKKIFPNEDIKPINYLVTRWDNDKYSFGAYSYLPVGCSPSHVDELSKPEMDNQLYFGGEATLLEYQGSTVGAYLSGIQQAKKNSRKVSEIDLDLDLDLDFVTIALIKRNYYNFRVPMDRLEIP